MAEEIKGTVSFQCAGCGSDYSLTSDEIDLDTVGGSERGMGAETLYASAHHLDCDSCHQKITVHVEISEYPVGVINNVTHSEIGASNVVCDFEYVYSLKAPPENENRMIGAAAGGAILGASLAGPAGAVFGGLIGAVLGKTVNKSKTGGSNG